MRKVWGDKGGIMGLWTGTGLALMVAVVLYAPTLHAQIDSNEFRRRTLNHVERVAALGESVRQEFPEYFGDLSADVVREYLSEFHDAPKLLPLHMLRAYGYTAAHGIDEVLSKYYGINRVLNSLSDQEQEELNSTINELNRIEAAIKEGFLTQRRLTAQQVRSLHLLEKAVDLADTGMARWAELGVAKEQALASNFVSQAKGQEELLQVILWVEDHYDRLVSGMPIPTAFTCESILQSVGR